MRCSLFAERLVRENNDANSSRDFLRGENFQREMSSSEFRGSSASNWIRKVQLLSGDPEWRSFIDSSSRDARNFLYSANRRVRPETDDERQRSAQRDRFCWHHHVIAPVGLSGRHARPTKGDNADALHLVHCHNCVKLRKIFLGFYRFTLLQWTFVSLI